MSTAPDFTQHPAWLDFEGQVWERSGSILGFGDDTMRVDSERAHRLAPWTPLDTAEAWCARIDRDKLIDLLGNEWGDPVWVADAVLAALPELMGGSATPTSPRIF